MTAREPAVAIDGPAGAGKSTVSQVVANRLGYTLLDTGALYRSVALAAQREQVPWEDAPAVARVARELAGRASIRFDRLTGGVRLDGEDVSSAIRTQDIGQGASQVSAVPAVRDALLDVQRQAAAAGGVVVEGRDIGTVVLPAAEAKFFLTASADERALRRLRQLQARGERASLEEVLNDVIARDERDSRRAVAPLRRAEDAFLVDTTGVPFDAVVDRIVAAVEAVRRRLGLPERA